MAQMTHLDASFGLAFIVVAHHNLPNGPNDASGIVWAFFFYVARLKPFSGAPGHAGIFVGHHIRQWW